MDRNRTKWECMPTLYAATPLPYRYYTATVVLPPTHSSYSLHSSQQHQHQYLVMLSIARCSGHWRGMLLSLELVVIYHGIATTKVHSFQISQTQQCRLFNPPPSSSVFLGSSGANDDGEENYSSGDIPARSIGDEDDASMQSSSTSNAASSVTMDDGGSDLTDRFKYKVRFLCSSNELINIILRVYNLHNDSY